MISLDFVSSSSLVSFAKITRYVHRRPSIDDCVLFAITVPFQLHTWWPKNLFRLCQNQLKVTKIGFLITCFFLVTVLSFWLSFCKQINWQTRKRTSTKLGRRRQEVVEWEIFGHLLAFLIQSTANLYHTWRNYRRRQDRPNASTTFWDRSDGLIRKSIFESRITFGWNFDVGGDLRSLSTLVRYLFYLLT